MRYILPVVDAKPKSPGRAATLWAVTALLLLPAGVLADDPVPAPRCPGGYETHAVDALAVEGDEALTIGTDTAFVADRIEIHGALLGAPAAPGQPGASLCLNARDITITGTACAGDGWSPGRVVGAVAGDRIVGHAGTPGGAITLIADSLHIAPGGVVCSGSGGDGQDIVAYDASLGAPGLCHSGTAPSHVTGGPGGDAGAIHVLGPATPHALPGVRLGDGGDGGSVHALFGNFAGIEAWGGPGGASGHPNMPHGALLAAGTPGTGGHAAAVPCPDISTLMWHLPAYQAAAPDPACRAGNGTWNHTDACVLDLWQTTCRANPDAAGLACPYALSSGTQSSDEACGEPCITQQCEGEVCVFIPCTPQSFPCGPGTPCILFAPACTVDTCFYPIPTNPVPCLLQWITTACNYPIIILDDFEGSLCNILTGVLGNPPFGEPGKDYEAIGQAGPVTNQGQNGSSAGWQLVGQPQFGISFGTNGAGAGVSFPLCNGIPAEDGGAGLPGDNGAFATAGGGTGGPGYIKGGTGGNAYAQGGVGGGGAHGGNGGRGLVWACFGPFTVSGTKGGDGANGQWGGFGGDGTAVGGRGGNATLWGGDGGSAEGKGSTGGPGGKGGDGNYADMHESCFTSPLVPPACGIYFSTHDLLGNQGCGGRGGEGQKAKLTAGPGGYATSGATGRDGAHPPNGYEEIPGENGPLGPPGAGKPHNCETLEPLLDYVEDVQEVLE